jgi:hypothetical protein
MIDGRAVPAITSGGLGGTGQKLTACGFQPAHLSPARTGKISQHRAPRRWAVDLDPIETSLTRAIDAVTAQLSDREPEVRRVAL